MRTVEAITQKVLLPAVKLLAERGNEFAIACALLAGQAAENALSCLYLATVQDAYQARLRDMKHSLVDLWGAAHASNACAPEWLRPLNDGHDSPYVYRYEKRINATTTPSLEPLVRELEALTVKCGG